MNHYDFSLLKHVLCKMSRGQMTHYGMIFQVKQGGELSKLDSSEIQRYLKVSVNGKLYVDNELPDGPLKSYMIGAVATLNKADDVLISFHDGNEDPNCEYNGFHWHVIAHLLVHPTRDSRWGRRLLDISRDSQETVFTSVVVNSVPAFARHIVKPPRVQLFLKGEAYAPFTSQGDQAEATEGETTLTAGGSPDWDRANLKQDATFFRIVALSKLMAKYKCVDLGVLNTKVKLGRREDWNKLLELKCAASWDTISRKAAELYCSEECTKNLSERMRESPPWGGETEFYMDAAKSMETFNEWIKWNGFDKTQFIDDLFAVLSRRDPKKNTFMLQGPTCAGKSWLLRSLIYFYPFYGEVHGMGNYNFAYQGCLDKALILMEEPMLEPAVVDHAKKVLEGHETLVNVKCKGPQLLQPTPVLITSNHDLWKWCPMERETLLTRINLYMCKRAPWLKTVRKQINPVCWWRLYHNWEVTQEGLIDEMLDDSLVEAADAAENANNPTWAPKGERQKPISQEDAEPVRKRLRYETITSAEIDKQIADALPEYLPMADADGVQIEDLENPGAGYKTGPSYMLANGLMQPGEGWPIIPLTKDQ